jgi:acyl dehydratase
VTFFLFLSEFDRRLPWSHVFRIMNRAHKDSTIESLGLADGVHWLKMVVAGDTVEYEFAAKPHSEMPERRKPIGFVHKWGGTSRRIEQADDEWLSHINAKHLR